MGSISPRNSYRPLGDIAGADLDPDRNSLLDPIPVFHTAAKIARIDLDVDRCRRVAKLSQRGRGSFGRFEHRGAGFLFRRYGDDHRCAGAIRGGKNEPIVVAMGHDERADQPGAHSPAGRPRIFELAVARLKLNPARLREILPEEMRGSGLDGLSILDHRLDAKRLHRSGKALAFRLLAGE